MSVRTLLLFALLASPVASAASISNGPADAAHFVPRFVLDGLTIGRQAKSEAPYGNVRVEVTAHRVMRFEVEAASPDVPKPGLGMDAIAGTVAAKALTGVAPSFWTVRGGQHASEASYQDKVYWVEIAGPGQPPLTFEVTWQGSFGQGVAADAILVDAAKNYLQSR